MQQRIFWNEEPGGDVEYIQKSILWGRRNSSGLHGQRRLKSASGTLQSATKCSKDSRRLQAPTRKRRLLVFRHRSGAREAEGFTCYTVAKLAGILSPNTVRDIEYGRDAKLSNVPAVAKALGLHLELVRELG